MRNFILAIGFMLSVAGTVAAQATYSVIDLGRLNGGYDTSALGINNQGHVVGTAMDNSGHYVAFFYSGSLQGLGGLGGSFSKANGINFADCIVGRSTTAAGQTHAFLYDAAQVNPAMVDLHNVIGFGGSFSSATSINGAGQIVGAADNVNGNLHAFILTGNTAVDLHSRVSFGGANSFAYAISDTGWVAGISDDVNGNSRAFLYNLNTSTLTNLGTLGGLTSAAMAVNGAGSVVGNSDVTADGATSFAFQMLQASPMSASNGLGALGGVYSFAFGINASGQVVGEADDAADSAHAFLYTQTAGMQDLENLIPANSGWMFSYATAINDSGYIVGNGIHNGRSAAFLLIPIANTTCDNPTWNSFAPAVNFGVNFAPVSVTTGDFNGDGNLDIATANADSASVSILLGAGAGMFAPATNISIGAFAYAVAAADLNGDGKLDLAVAGRNANAVFLLLGNGTGGFAAPTSFAVGARPQSVAVADFNSDGKLDIAAGNSVSNNVSVLLGDGAGGFGPATNFAVGTTPFSVAAADFNGDGKLDLAVANHNSNNVSVLLGDGAGSFGAATNFAVGDLANSITVGDLNGDGKWDLAVATSSGAAVLLGNGAGGFGAATNFGAGSVSVAVRDFNGDAKPDLALVNFTSNNVSVLLGDGSGNFAASADFALGSGPESVVAADLNGDGTSDLAAVNSNSDNVSVLLNGGWTCPTPTPSPTPAPGGTVVVINTNDSGAGSLRQAILDTNSAPGSQKIAFNISGGIVQTITPSSPLPAITDPVIIDGTTQPGFAGSPIIELNGTNLTGGAQAFYITAGNSTIKGLVINRTSGNGIAISTNGGNVIEGNFIGTNAAGTAVLGNGQGIFIENSPNNVIGGLLGNSRNIVSGNGASGVHIFGPGSTGNIVEGNLIGTDVGGNTGVGNGGAGVFINGAGNNLVGGASAAARNVISGNGNVGVGLVAGATANHVQGNLIGTNAAGTEAIPNLAGVNIDNSSNNVIGGTVAVARNLISGNTNNGIRFGGSNSHDNSVRGNFIGTDVTGTLRLPNLQHGVLIQASASGNLIGGDVPEARNVISGNKAGVAIGLDSPANNNTVQGNYIGLTANGNAALGNQFDGVDLVSSSGNNITGNVVSANGSGGISLFTANNNSVQGNMVGTNASGTTPLGNVLDGIFVGSSSGNTIGGTGSAERNLISGNRVGLVLSDLGSFNATGSSNNVAQGNFIGTDISGNSPIGNNAGGLSIFGSSSNNLIGGNTAGAGNLISGNNGDGVAITQAASANTLQGNRIGTNVSGLAALGNTGRGVFIESSNNTIGGGALGPNIIAFNHSSGILISGGLRNGILSNAIFLNAGPGIVLAAGANNNQAAPVLSSAVTSGGHTTIYATLNSTPNTTFNVQFFANNACDPSGNGEGQTFLGSTSVTTGPFGDVSFGYIFQAALSTTQVVTATATDANNNTSAFSSCRAVLQEVPTSTSVVSSLNPSFASQSVTFTANVTSNSTTPTGFVEFFDNGQSLGVRALSAGSASLTTAALTTGNHVVTVSYNGPPPFLPSTSATLTQVVNKWATNTTLTSSLNPSGLGQLVTFTASVTSSNGTPTGTVQFLDYGQTIGTASLSAGSASLPTSTLTAGSHSITVVYTGDTTFLGSSSSALIQTVVAACDDTWTATNTTNAPAARYYSSAVWTGSEMIVWGGAGNSGLLNTGGRYDPATNTWTPVSTTNAPTARYIHSAVWTGSEMIVWGGNNGSSLNTGGRYNPGTNTWTAMSTNNAPSARSQFTAVWTGSEMIVWGGISTSSSGSGNLVNTGGRYNPNTNTWTPITTTNAPAARFEHKAVWTGSEMIVWGGSDNITGRANTGGRYNPNTNSWAPLSTTNAPQGRFSHTAVWTGSEMIVWGGLGITGRLNTGGRYNPSINSWTPTNTINGPIARNGHAAVWTGNEMIVWAGNDNGDARLNTGGRYNPSTDTWIATNTANAPDARVVPLAAWTGSHLVIWGGAANTGALNTGGRYCAGSPATTPTRSPSATTVISSLNPSIDGQAVTFTANVTAMSGTPTGSVEFFDYGQSLGVVGLSGGSASITTAALPAGSHSITAVYAGDANFLGSTSSVLIQSVAAATSVGSNVTVQETAGATVVSINFTNVTVPGTTTIAPIDPASAGTVPGGFVLVGGSVAFEVSTTASFIGPVTVCFQVPSVNDQVTFSGLRILHSTPNLDLATANLAASNTSVLIGNGRGGFATSNFAAGTNPKAIATGDFNGDAKPDVVLNAFGSNSVSVLLGDGSGGFGPATSVVVGTAVEALQVADLNADSKTDIATAGSGSLSIMLGNGTGGFSVVTNVIANLNPVYNGLALGDFNRDGKIDFAVANYNVNNNSTVSILLGNGLGGAALATNVPVGAIPHSIAVGDFNGDSRLDMAVANYGSGIVSVLLANSSGGFVLANNLRVPLAPITIAAGDLNGDRKVDLLVGEVFTGKSSIFLGDGGGGFVAAGSVAIGSPQSLVLADFNNDGKLDVAAVGGGNVVSVRLGLGNGSFGAVTNYPVGTNPTALAIGNFNRDVTVVDQTILSGPNAPNFATKTICAQVLSFSPFVIASALDQTSPVISSVSADPSVIREPDHKMVDVTVNYDVSDDFATASEIVASLEVSSNEPVNTGGDGNTEPDVEIVDAHHLRLRAERSGSGGGRVYTITITCKDSAQNSSAKTTTVFIPRSQE